MMATSSGIRTISAKALAEAFKAGESVAAIAAKFSCSEAQLWGLHDKLVDAGMIEPRPRPGAVVEEPPAAAPVPAKPASPPVAPAGAPATAEGPTPVQEKTTIFRAPLVEEEVDEEQGVELWNPNAVMSWSVLFSPIFGALLIAENLKALGDEARAKRASLWVWATVAVVVLTPLFISHLSDGVRVYLGLMVGWMWLSARPHRMEVEREFGDDYPRRSWRRPLMIAGPIWLGLLIFNLIFMAFFPVP